MLDYDIKHGDSVCVVCKRSGIEYVGIFLGFTPHHYFNKLMHVDVSQQRNTIEEEWNFFDKKVHKTFIFENNWISTSSVDNLFLLCK